MSFGSLRMALIYTIPQSDPGFDACVGDDSNFGSFCLTFSIMMALAPQNMDPRGVVPSASFVNSNETFRGPREMPPGQICGLRGPTVNQTLTEIPSFYLGFVSPTLMCTKVMYPVPSEYQC